MFRALIVIGASLIFGNGALIAWAQSTNPASKIQAELSLALQNTPADQMRRVIIEYRPPAGMERMLDSDINDASRRLAVRVGRERLLTSMAAETLSASRRRGGIKRTYDYVPYLAFEGTPSEIEAFAQNLDVVHIYEDGSVQTMLNHSTSPLLVDAETTRALGYTGKGTAIAIIDTGVAKNHDMFGAHRIVAEACFVTDDATCAGDSAVPPFDIDWTDQQKRHTLHGTHVAGIAAGSSSGEYLLGVAPSADLIALRVFNLDTRKAMWSDVIKALEFVYHLRNDHNIAAVNMSLGNDLVHPETCDDRNPSLADMMKLLSDADIAVVVSSGNDSSSSGLSSPACISHAISVGSTEDGYDGTIADEVSDFSNSAVILDLLAPGERIYSAYGLINEYQNNQGTSMAAPHVAGAFAVLKSAVPTASREDILYALKSTGKPITDPRNGITKPRIDVYRALQKLQNGSEPPTFIVVPLNGFTLIPISAL